MATKKAKQPYQYEPLVTPSSWRDDEQRFSIRLTQIIDDLYQKYSALRQKTKNVEPSTPTDEPVDADTLNGKPPSYYLTAANLLVNGYFVNPVNQRGFISGDSVASWEYIIDRWINTGNAAKVFTLTDKGMGLEADTTLCQRLEGVKSGTVLTFAACLSDGTIVVTSGTVVYNADDSWLRLGTTVTELYDLYIDTYAGYLQAIVYTRRNVELKWAALYEGEYTAETLPPYVPKGYADELLACNIAETGRVHDSDKLGGVPAEEYATKEDLSTIDIPAGVQMDLLWEKQGSGIQVGSSFPLAGDITNYDFIVMVSNHYKVGHRAFWFKPVVNSTVAVSAFGIANDTVTQLFVNEFVLQQTSVTYSQKRGINLSTSIQSFSNIGDLLSTIYGVKGLLK